MDTNQQTDLIFDNHDARDLARRSVLRALAGGFVLSASAPFVLAGGEEAEARGGAFGGKLGGRHGPNRRGRDRNRDDGKQKGNRKGNDNPPRSLILKDVAFNLTNDSDVPGTYEFWYDAHPFGSGGWARDIGPGTLEPKNERRYQSPTISGGLWLTGTFGQFWVVVENEPIFAPRVAVYFGGTMEKGKGHRGGDFQDQDRPNEGEQLRPYAQNGYVLTVRREKDSDSAKVYSVHLRQAES